MGGEMGGGGGRRDGLGREGGGDGTGLVARDQEGSGLGGRGPRREAHPAAFVIDPSARSETPKVLPKPVTGPAQLPLRSELRRIAGASAWASLGVIGTPW